MTEIQYSLLLKCSDNSNVAQMSATQLVSLTEENEQLFFFLRAHDIKSLYVSKVSLNFPSPYTMHTRNQTLKIVFSSAKRIFPFQIIDN